MDGYPDEVEISSPEWPEGCGDPRPGDLRRFVPQGFGLGAPPIVTPYGGVASGSYYGFDAAQAHPFLNGPRTDSCGGTIYFDDNAEAASLIAALELMGVYRSHDYVAFAAGSDDPPAERYLDQLRLLSIMALKGLFRATIPDPAPKQRLDIIETAAAFVRAQKEKWNDRYAYSEKLAGTAGGDGDWAKESLAFGFHVENTYWGVYRIWSRPWLVTK